MGNNQPQRPQYNIEHKQGGIGETPTYRHPTSVNGELISSPQEGITTLKDLWNNSVKNFPQKGCQSQRNAQEVYETKTYVEIDKIAREIGSGISNLNLAPINREYRDFELQFVGIYSKNRWEWMQIDIGCSWLMGMTAVPLYDTLGPENISYCLNHTNLEVLFADKKSMNTLEKTQDLGKLKYIVAFDEFEQQQRDAFQQRGIKIYTYEEVREAGRNNLVEKNNIQPDNVFTFSYTSGTTGNPKAAMLSHKNVISMTSIFKAKKLFIINDQDVHLSYLPLPHVFDRVISTACFAKGAHIYYYSGDPLKLKQDLKDVRPTFFCSVPRLYNKFYDAIMGQMRQATGIKKFLIDSAISKKTENLQGNDFNHRFYDSIVFSKIREDLFGGRVKFCLTGSAPLDPEVLNFFKIALSCPFVEVYGQTESTGGSFLTDENDYLSGHVGGIECHTEFKLVDIPEMNYLSTDKDSEGRSQPRGEVCFRGPTIFRGYYKDEEKTRECIDDQGFVHSGDVGMLIPPYNELKIVDRKKNIFKLSQGEYVAPEKIENIYTKLEGIAEMFVYGDSLQSHCIGVAIPEQAYIEKVAKNLGLQEQDFKVLCTKKEVRQKVIEEMYAHGKKQLNGFEQVKNIKLLPDSFAVHGCLTNTAKLQRHHAKNYFKDDLQALYQEQPLIR